MKKTIVALVLMVGVLAGCQPDPYAGWNTYSDPQGEFTVRYPTDWTQTDATDEVQFWDSFDDGQNSIKMVLTKDSTTLNGKEVKITRGTSLNVPYQTYEYPFDTFMLNLTALFNDDTPEFRELATKVQESLKTLN